MMRAISYVLVLSGVIFAMFYASARDVRFAESKLRACAEQPTQDCLAHAAAALGAKAVNSYYTGVIVSDLMRLGYVDEAYDLASRSGQNESIDVSERFSKGYFSLAEKLRESSGKPVADVIREFSEQDGGHGLSDSVLFLAGLELLGRMPNETVVPYDAPVASKRKSRAWVAVLELVNAIEALPEHENPRVNSSRAGKIVKLYRLLGLPEQALEALALAVSDSTMSWGEIEMLARSDSALRVAKILEGEGAQGHPAYFTALAGVAHEQGEDGADVEVLLRRAGALALTKDALGWFKKMRAVILMAHQIGQDDLARELLAEFYSEVKMDKIFPWFSMMEVAGAYGDIGDVEAALERLEEAIALIPVDKSKIIAIGHVGGAYSFGSWGLDRETYVKLATEYTRIGDYGRAEYYLGLIKERIRYAWWGVYQAQGRDIQKVRLLIMAQGVLGHEDMVWLRSAAAQWEAVNGEREVARVLIDRVVSELPEIGVECEPCYRTYAALLIAAHHLNDEGLATIALRGAAQSALIAKKPNAIMKTVTHWHEFFPTIELERSQAGQ